MEDSCVDTVEVVEEEPIATTSFQSNDTPSVENEETIDENDDDLKPPVLKREEPVPATQEIAHSSAAAGEAEENVISISHEDLAEAGLDIESINNLSNEQITTLMEIAERRAQRELLTPQAVVVEEKEISVVDEQNYQEAAPSNNGAITIVITDDGSLKVKNALGQVFFFPAEQLNAMNIDVNNLTDESISQIVNEAMPSIQSGRKQEQETEKAGESSRYKPGPSAATSTSFKPDAALLRLIGEQVEIRKNNGKTSLATIRFVKNGGAFKVQFEDGHFEWITEDQIIVRQASNDHDRYHNGSLITNRPAHASTTVNALKRAASTGNCREVKRTPGEPNFCCPICDNKVYQKEPAYIVIRIPACESCTKEKIIVLDDERDGDAI